MSPRDGANPLAALGVLATLRDVGCPIREDARLLTLGLLTLFFCAFCAFWWLMPFVLG